MASAALDSLQAADCAAQAAGFGPDSSASGLLAADELAHTRVGGTAESGGVPRPVDRQAVTADQAPLTLLQFPAEVLFLVLCRLDAQNLARLAATCSELFREPMAPVV